MSRYLTPSKIGLLALISLYSESNVPSAAIVPILSFVISFLIPGSSSEEHVGQSKDVSFSIEALQRATITHASGIPGRTIWDLLLKKLWETNSSDALYGFFDNLSFILARPRDDLSRDEQTSGQKCILLSRTSPLGAFVRRSQLEFTRLQFHDVIGIWNNFIHFREPTFTFWKKRNPDARKGVVRLTLNEELLDPDSNLALLVDSVSLKEPLAKATRAIYSTDDIEKLLEYQINQMQKMSSRMPLEVRSQIRRMIQDGSTTPNLARYTEFLDAWKAGDYPSAFENLHCYFDYTMQNRDRTFYQYALLNLAVLHADFGCFSEAIIAMHETIATARENNDITCLNYSLSWLYHFSKTHPQCLPEIKRRGVLREDSETLAFIKTKAKETCSWSLVSTALLSEAKLALSNGDGVAMAFEGTTKSSHLNITKDVANVVGSQMLMQSSIFGRLGISCQAALISDLFLRCHTKQCPTEDIINSICRQAHLLSLKGKHSNAMIAMESIEPELLRTLKYQQYWTVYMGLLKTQHALHRNDFEAVHHLLPQLSLGHELGQDMSYSISLLEIDLHVRCRNFSMAMEVLEKMGDDIKDHDTDVFQRIELMTLKARIWDKAGYPQKGFSLAMRAASVAHSAYILPALWDSVVVICRILISLGEFGPSAALMESIMPQVLECEDCHLAGQSFSCLADSYVGLAGEATAEGSQRKERLTKALGSFDAAFDEWSRVQDVSGQCEMMAKKATIMHLMGEPILANDCAAKYLDIKKAAKEENRV